MTTKDWAAELARLSSSIVGDARAGKGVVAPGISRFSGSGVVAGQAITADCEIGSLQAVFAALDQARPGDFLIVSGPGETAYLGEILATHLVKRGLVGAVIDGLMRDRDAISRMSASFFARGLFPYNQRTRAPGRPMVKVTLGGVTTSPGDWIIADDDGIVVIPADEIAATLAAAQAGAALEERILALVQEGKSPPDAVRQAMSERNASASA